MENEVLITEEARGHYEISEIVTGMILTDKLTAKAVTHINLSPTHKVLVEMKAKGMDKAEMIQTGNLSDMLSCERAAIAVNGSIHPTVWVDILDKSAASTRVASLAIPKLERMLKGEHVDIEALKADLAMLDTAASGLIPMSQIEPTKQKWIETGFKPIDHHTGGLPDASLIILAASPGIGKTTLAVKIAMCMTKKYDKKNTAIFTLEMTGEQICMRAIEMDESMEDAEKRERILVADATMNVNQVFSMAAKANAEKELSLVVVDYADLLITGEQSEATMGLIYRTLQQLAKHIKCPVILVSQLNRAAYAGGTPAINHIRYSGLAEATAALIFMAYNPTNIVAEFGKQDKLPMLEGQAYLIVGKSKYGYKHGGPGAIAIGWDGKFGWTNKAQYTPSDWKSLSY